jgi:hypothetical protein
MLSKEYLKFFILDFYYYFELKFYHILKVIIKKRPQQIIERVHETPKRPPPRVVEKIVYEPVPVPVPPPCACGPIPVTATPINCVCGVPTISSAPIPASLTITSAPYYPTTSTSSSTYQSPMGF